MMRRRRRRKRRRRSSRTRRTPKASTTSCPAWCGTRCPISSGPPAAAPCRASCCSPSRRGCASPCGTCPGSTKPTPTPFSPAATGWAPRTSARPSSVSSGLARTPPLPPQIPCPLFPVPPAQQPAGPCLPSRRGFPPHRRAQPAQSRPGKGSGGARGAGPGPKPHRATRGPGCPAGGGGAAGVRAAPGQPHPPGHRRRPQIPRHHRCRVGQLPTGLLPRRARGGRAAAERGAAGAGPAPAAAPGGAPAPAAHGGRPQRLDPQTRRRVPGERHHLHGTARRGAAAGGPGGAGGPLGGAEIRGAPAAHLRHQVRRAPVVPGDRLEPAHRLVLPPLLPALLLPALLPAPPGRRRSPLQPSHPAPLQARGGPAPPAAPRPHVVVPAAAGVPGAARAGGRLGRGDGAGHEGGGGAGAALLAGLGEGSERQFRALRGRFCFRGGFPALAAGDQRQPHHGRRHGGDGAAVRRGAARRPARPPRPQGAPQLLHRGLRAHLQAGGRAHPSLPGAEAGGGGLLAAETPLRPQAPRHHGEHPRPPREAVDSFVPPPAPSTRSRGGGGWDRCPPGGCGTLGAGAAALPAPGGSAPARCPSRCHQPHPAPPGSPPQPPGPGSPQPPAPAAGSSALGGGQGAGGGQGGRRGAVMHPPGPPPPSPPVAPGGGKIQL